MARALPVEEVKHARWTRYWVTGTSVALIAVAGAGYFTRVQEEREDCREQRAAIVDRNQDEVALLEDLRDALLDFGAEPTEVNPLFDDVVTRAQRRQHDRPPPSACT